ncbi:MAG TPA: LysE family transporter, partial [Hyphomicrobiales bacterium]|nr:LysE family transporter [Hyphomicrobiales bacterium]
LLWLAWQIGSAPVTASGAGAGPAEIDRRGTFFGAALFQWINPKAWLIATAVISAYMNEDSSALTQGAFFGAVFILAATVGCLPWLALGAVLGRFLQRPAYCRAFNVTMAVLLVGSMLPVLADFGRGAGQSLPTISETTPAMASATAASTGAPKSKRAPSMP